MGWGGMGWDGVGWGGMGWDGKYIIKNKIKHAYFKTSLLVFNNMTYLYIFYALRIFTAMNILS